ncbi:hypothetical protein OHA61_22430 [Streptomyces sp. NBC_00885]|nr:hypothetical protein OHA61_22430 [Streptomyces sp. NBC_00885]
MTALQVVAAALDEAASDGELKLQTWFLFSCRVQAESAVRIHSELL